MRIPVRVSHISDQVSSRIDKRRDESAVLDLALRFLERDREIDGSVIGSALALRVFLFFVPLLLVLVGALGFLGTRVSSDDAANEVGVGGGLADQIDTALQQSSGSRWAALLTGLVGAAWAGRSLSKVLVVASRRAWTLAVPAKPPALRVVGAIAGLIGGLGVMTITVNRIRQDAGIGVATTMLVGAAAVYAAGWFVVLLALPRRSSDPSALLPGAVLVGAALAILQWFVQFYLPPRVAHASQLYGSIGATIVTLGWFFILGRTFVASIELNAVVWERFGSLSEFVFSLPGLRRVPARWPRLGQFFGVAREPEEHDRRSP